MSEGTEPITWTGRFIVRQDGHVDLPMGRHDATGPDVERKRFLAKLNETLPPKTFFDIIAAKLRSGEISTRERKDVILFDDNGILVTGNANASAGYFYVLARPAIRTEDGETVCEGDRVYACNDRFWGTLGAIDDEGRAEIIGNGRKTVASGWKILTFDPMGSTDPEEAL